MKPAKLQNLQSHNKVAGNLKVHEKVQSFSNKGYISKKALPQVVFEKLE